MSENKNDFDPHHITMAIKITARTIITNRIAQLEDTKAKVRINISMNKKNKKMRTPFMDELNAMD